MFLKYALDISKKATRMRRGLIISPEAQNCGVGNLTGFHCNGKISTLGQRFKNSTPLTRGSKG